MLKPGGILGSRDMDVPASFIAPAHESNRGMWEMLGEVIKREGGNPWMGRQLKCFFINAGLESVEPGYGADFFESPEEVAFLEKFPPGVGPVPGVRGKELRDGGRLQPVAGAGAAVEPAPGRRRVLPLRPRGGAQAIRPCLGGTFTVLRRYVLGLFYSQTGCP